MNTYLVWTEQINQQLIEVKANSREEAVHKAQKIARPALGHIRTPRRLNAGDRRLK